MKTRMTIDDKVRAKFAHIKHDFLLFGTIPSPLSPQGEVRLEYSGSFMNPPIPVNYPERLASLYDIGKTLIDGNRDEVIEQELGVSPRDFGERLFVDREFTQSFSDTQTRLIHEGKIKLNPLDGVVEQIEHERENGYLVGCATVGTRSMAQSFLKGGGLYTATDFLGTSEECHEKRVKTPDMIFSIYSNLKARGIKIIDYCDDSARDASAALEASKLAEGSYGTGFMVFKIRADARPDELGMQSNGLIVIRNTKEKQQYKSMKYEMLERHKSTDKSCPQPNK